MHSGISIIIGSFTDVMFLLKKAMFISFFQGLRLLIFLLFFENFNSWATYLYIREAEMPPSLDEFKNMVKNVNKIFFTL